MTTRFIRFILQIHAAVYIFVCVVGICSSNLVDVAGAQTKKLEYKPAPCDNPLKGIVPYADPVPNRFPHSMEFSYLKYSDLVKGPNKFDWTAAEKLFDGIKSRGNQAVFRVYLEFPGREDAIPKFLLEDGLKTIRWVDESWHEANKNVITPDYDNKDLRRSLVNFIEAFGNKYDGDPRIGYIHAGLLGLWGEWHTYPREDLWASKVVQTEVLEAYEKAFDKTPILLRYPARENHYAQAANTKYDFGYHDDSFAFATLATGKKKDDWFFEKLLKDAQATDKWKTNPIAGEVRPDVWSCCHAKDPCTPKGQSFAECRDKLHICWLMESGLFEKDHPAELKARAIVDAQKLGYEFFVESVSIGKTSSGKSKLTCRIKNTGIAPFYHSGWKVSIGLLSKKSASATAKLDWEFTGIMPGQTKVFEITTKADLSRGFKIGVPNPMPGGKALRFANKEVDKTGWLVIKP